MQLLPQLSSTQINWFGLQRKFDLPSWIMWQWAGVPVNAILNRRWTQLINHANYKNNSNDSPICLTLFPPWRACAIQRQFRLGMASYRKSLLTLHNMLKMCFLCFMNPKYKCLRCELAICNKCSNCYLLFRGDKLFSDGVFFICVPN